MKKKLSYGIQLIHLTAVTAKVIKEVVGKKLLVVRKAELHVSIEDALNKKNRKQAFKRIKNVDDETWERMKKSGPRPPELDRREIYCCIVCANAFYGGKRIQKEKHQWEAEGALTLGQ